MGHGDHYYTEEEAREGRYYLGNDLWTHPETGGDFFFEDERNNK